MSLVFKTGTVALALAGLAGSAKAQGAGYGDSDNYKRIPQVQACSPSLIDGREIGQVLKDGGIGLIWNGRQGAKDNAARSAQNQSDNKANIVRWCQEGEAQRYMRMAEFQDAMIMDIMRVAHDEAMSAQARGVRLMELCNDKYVDLVNASESYYADINAGRLKVGEKPIKSNQINEVTPENLGPVCAKILTTHKAPIPYNSRDSRPEALQTTQRYMPEAPAPRNNVRSEQSQQQFDDRVATAAVRAVQEAQGPDGIRYKMGANKFVLDSLFIPGQSPQAIAKEGPALPKGFTTRLSDGRDLNINTSSGIPVLTIKQRER